MHPGVMLGTKMACSNTLNIIIGCFLENTSRESFDECMHSVLYI